MKKFKKISEMLSVSLAGNVGQTRMLAALPAAPLTDGDRKVLAEASLWYDQNRTSVVDQVPVQQGRPVLTDERYVYKDFRALSQTLLPNRGLDFSTAGVLEAAVPMLAGKTVYPNHEFTDINNWVGVVAASSWDASAVNGAPGINCQIKLDAFLNYRIACGVMMTPPAINAMSLTVMFEFEYSHPQMAANDRWKFFDLLGEEVDGEIVRLIVTKIVEIWEASLVFLGEDRLAKGIEGDDPDEDPDADPDFAEMSARKPAETPANSNEEKTMKLTKEEKAQLGIEFDGEDVPEADVVKAGLALKTKVDELSDAEKIAELKANAEAGKAYIEKQRTEVTRLATLAECKADDDKAELPKVVADHIAAASFDTLVELEQHYQAKVGDKFKRSSVEDPAAIEAAGGVNLGATEKTVSDGGLFS